MWMSPFVYKVQTYKYSVAIATNKQNDPFYSAIVISTIAW